MKEHTITTRTDSIRHLIHVSQVGFVSDRFNAFLERYDLVIAGCDHHRFELQALTKCIVTAKIFPLTV